MKKFLMIFDAALGALCLTLGIVQGVVCILYWFVLDLSPSLRGQMPMLLGSTLIFSVVGLMFLAGFVGYWRRWNWAWALQAFVLIAAVPASLSLYRILTQA
jgi:hypothetical protein